MTPMASHIERRKFLATLGGATAWPLAARAQQSTVPVIGWLAAEAREPVSFRRRSTLPSARGQGRRPRPHPSNRDQARNHRGNEDEDFHSSAGERHQGGARAIPSQSPADAENHGAGN